jgi:hypothetical protein
MGEFLVQLMPEELQGCRVAVDIIKEKTLELGLLKRGHQHLWNDIAKKYDLVGKKIEVNYETGSVTEKSGPSLQGRPLDVQVVNKEVISWLT